MARLSRQKSDNFIMNQAAAFAASSNMTGKYASAGGIPPIAEEKRSCPAQRGEKGSYPFMLYEETGVSQ